MTTPADSSLRLWLRSPAAVLTAKVGLCVVALAMIFYRALYLPLLSPAVDYGKHWKAARAMMAGESPYLGDLFLSFNYPLFAGVLYLPLGWFGIEEAFWLWTGAKMVQLLIGLVLIAWLMRPKAEDVAPGPEDDPQRRFRVRLQAWWVPVVLLVFANYQPMHVARGAGNIEPVIFLFVSLALVLFVKGRDGWGGVALAGGVLVKLAPVFILIPLVALRRWRAVGGCLAVLAAYWLVLLVTGAWRTEMVLYREVLPAIPHYWQHISISIHRVLAEQAFPAVLESKEAFERFVFVLNAGMMAVYLGVVGAWYFTGPERRDGLNLLAFGTFMVLPFTPLLEINHFLWVFGAYFLHVVSYVRGGLGVAPLAAVSVAFAGIMMLRQFGFGWWLHRLMPAGGPPDHFYHMLVLVGLVACSGWCAFWRRAEERPANS